MAIKGITDRQASFPEIGQLRKGDEKKDERKPGADLTYFRFTSQDKDVTKAFQAAYGSEPKDINCYLPFDTTDENFMTAKEEWRAGGLIHRCDGETCEIWLDDSGVYRRDPKPCLGNCKEVGRLKIIIPELRRLAYVTVLTSSVHDIITLSECLMAFEMLGKSLRGIPFVLRRRPRMISTPSGKGNKRARREKWLLSIEANPAWGMSMLAQLEQNAYPALASGAPDDGDEPDYIETESGLTVDASTGEVIDKQPSEPQNSNGHIDDQKQKELDRFLSVTQIELGLEDDDTRTILSDLGEKLTVGRVDELIEIFRGQMENPTCDHALLVVVNRETANKEKPGGYYDNAYHLKNGIAKYLAQNDGSFDWPPKTADDWADARAVAVQYARDQMGHAGQATQEPLIEAPEPKGAVQYE